MVVTGRGLTLEKTFIYVFFEFSRPLAQSTELQKREKGCVNQSRTYVLIQGLKGQGFQAGHMSFGNSDNVTSKATVSFY